MSEIALPDGPVFLLLGRDTIRFDRPRLVRGADQAVRQAAGKTAVVVRDAFDVLGNPARLACYGDGRVTAAVRLKSLALDATFHLRHGPDRLVPWFGRDPDAVRAVFEWTPPADMLVHFACSMSLSSGRWTPSDFYLFALREGQKQVYRLPLANTHADARFCLGEGARRICEPTVAGALARAVELFRSSPWNGDLFDGQVRDRCWRLVRFHPAGRETLPPDGDWQELCFRVGNSVIEEVFA